MGKTIRRVFGLAGRRCAARGIVVIPVMAGTALYYGVTWVERYGEDEEKKRYMFLYYSLPGPLSRIHIKSEGFFGLANNNINTEWQTFNKGFDIKSEDEQAIHALLTGPVWELLMAQMWGIHMGIAGGEAFLRLSNYKSEDSIAHTSLVDEWFARVPGFFLGRRQRRLGAFRRSDRPPPGSLPHIYVKSQRLLR